MEVAVSPPAYFHIYTICENIPFPMKCQIFLTLTIGVGILIQPLWEFTRLTQADEDWEGRTGAGLTRAVGGLVTYFLTMPYSFNYDELQRSSCGPGED